MNQLDVTTVDPHGFPVHPKGSRARVLLTSVFGPYAQDDAYGSRVINPMELYHNQVTRVQGPFSFRTFHRSWGLMLIQVNLQAPCTLLDFPTQERFVEELKTCQYDVIGISSIMTNLLKVRRMCKLIRKHQPQATIVIGGHIANISRCSPSGSTSITSSAATASAGCASSWAKTSTSRCVIRRCGATSVAASWAVMLRDHPGDDCATLIPSVGCPMGCNFCSTSAMFGGKGQVH